MFVLCRIGADFDLSYHPDEAYKGKLAAEWNWRFTHPQLQVNLARLISVLTTGGADDPTAIVTAGRVASALLAAGAVGLATLAGFVGGRRPAGLAVGLLMLTMPGLAVYGHYFKEDSSLALSTSAALLALVCDRKRATRCTAVGIGVAAALAVSGKYIGVIWVPLLFAAMWYERHRRRRSTRAQLLDAASACATMIVVIAVVNFELLFSLADFLEGLKYEVDHVTSSHEGLRNRSTPTLMTEHVVRFVTPATLLGIVVAAGFALRRDALRYAPAVAYAVWVIVLGVLLMRSAIYAERYALPLYLAAPLLLGALAGRAMQRGRPAKIRYAAAALVVVVACLQGARTAHFVRHIHNDSRERLATWATRNITPGHRVLFEIEAGNELATQLIESGVQVVPIKRLGTPEGRATAAQFPPHFVVITSHGYERYFTDAFVPTDDFRDEYERARRFYVSLEQAARLVFFAHADGTRVPWPASPEVRVYDVRPNHTPPVEPHLEATPTGFDASP